MNVDDIVQQRIEAARRKAAADKEARAAFTAARTRGLARRHAAKLRHLAEQTPDTTKAPKLPSSEAPTVAHSHPNP